MGCELKDVMWSCCLSVCLSVFEVLETYILLCIVSFCRLTLLLCFTGLTSSMLFDEQKSPYHVMLRQFTSLGGVDALLA